jgi:hypothetical protein
MLSAASPKRYSSTETHHTQASSNIEKMVLVSTQCLLNGNQGHGGGNANAATVAAKIALMLTMAAVSTTHLI